MCRKWETLKINLSSANLDLELQYFFYCYKVRYTESTCDLKVDVDDSVMFLKPVTLKYLCLLFCSTSCF